MIKTQVQKPLIPAQWYEILKLKKVEVIAQLTARSISHNIKDHIATLKSKLYKVIKQGIKTLTEQFKALIGNDWTQALHESGKTFKQFKRDLLCKFHPDKHSGSDEATTISQEINGWTEPCDDVDLDFDFDSFMAQWQQNMQRRAMNTWEGLYRGGYTVEEVIDYQYDQSNMQLDWGLPEEHTREEVAQAIQEWLDIRTAPEFITNFEAAHPGETWLSWEQARELHLLQQLVWKTSDIYVLYNQPNSYSASKYTKFGKLTKTKQRELINEHGNIFHTHIADVPVTIHYSLYSAPRTSQEVRDLIEDVVIKGVDYATAVETLLVK